MMGMIEAENVSKEWNGFPALRDIGLSVKEGDFFALFGRDDAGKTTLLHIIMGFLRSYSGDVKVMGHRPDALPDGLRGKLRFVPDDILWEEDITPLQYLKHAEAAAPDYDRKLQEELCGEFGIGLGEKLLSMTYKENKMVQVIAAVCAKPRLLVLDEPVNFLGREFYGRLLDYLKLWNRRDNMTILAAVEKYEDAEDCCTRYAYLKEGRIAAAGDAPKREKRSKTVSVYGGKKEILDKYLGEKLSERRGKTVYLYRGVKPLLLGALYKAECTDFTVETLAFEEELDRGCGGME